MKWTETYPQKPGYYWVNFPGCHGSSTQICRVMQLEENDPTLFLCIGPLKYTASSFFLSGALFAGPIPEPTP